MKTPCFLLLALVLFLSFPVSKGITGGPSTGEDTPPRAPIILSRLEGQTVIRFWSPPQQSPTVLYDRWDIVLYSFQNETVNITVNGQTVYNGWINGFLNVSHSVYSDRARVDIWQGKRYYNWTNILVKHKDIGYVPSELVIPHGGYDKGDLRWAQFKGALGVLIMGIVSMPIVWLGVKAWKDHQGVKQW